MNYILVAARPSNPREAEKLRQLLQSQGQDCQTLTNVWVIKTESSAGAIAGMLKAEMGHSTSYIVAPLQGAWHAGGQAKSSSDCFEIFP